MEAARLPMIFFNPKSSPDKAEFTTVLQQLISTHFGEDASNYSKECQELDQLRVAVVNAPLDYTACSTLKRYYCQLCFLVNRFPFLAEEKIKGLRFVWEDAYNGLETRHREIDFEKAAVLYNVAAIHSYLGSSDNRSTAEGMKMSCTHFQCAAWCYQHLKDNFKSSYCDDWAPEILSFQEQLMLAQSQECILEKSMADNRKAAITAKVAVQCADFYKKTLSHLESSNASSAFGSSQTKRWKKYIELKMHFTKCVTFYYLTVQAEEQSKYGERVTYAQAATDRLADCIKLSQDMDDDIKTSLKFISDVVTGKTTAAKKDNDFIYHAKIPTLDTLPEIKGAVLVKGLPFDVSDKEVSGPDIFSKLIPLEAHEASSLYSEEKAKLLRDVGGRIEEQDTILGQYMASLQLDPDKLVPEYDRIPDSLVEKCAAISIRPETMQELTDAMQALVDVSEETESKIINTERMIEEEQASETAFQEKYGKRKIPALLDEISAEIAKCKQAFSKASLSNQELHKAMDLHLQNLKLLASPLDEIKAALPNPAADLGDEEFEAVSRVKQLFQKISEMRSQRGDLYKQLREQVLSDDITKKIVTRSSDDTQSLFEEQLKKHNSLIEPIDMNLAAQPRILDALTQANVKFVPVLQKIDASLLQRESMIESLIYSYDVYKDLLDKQQKGMEFYQKLQHNVQKLLDKSTSLCEEQQQGRAKVEEKLKPKDPPPSRPSASKPIGGTAPSPATRKPPSKSSGPPKLKDYLPFMKNGGDAATAISSITEDNLDLDDLDDVQLPDLEEEPVAPKLKDFLPFMNKGPSAARDTGPLPSDIAGLPAAALKYLPQSQSGSISAHLPPVSGYGLPSGSPLITNPTTQLPANFSPQTRLPANFSQRASYQRPNQPPIMPQMASTGQPMSPRNPPAAFRPTTPQQMPSPSPNIPGMPQHPSNQSNMQYAPGSRMQWPNTHSTISQPSMQPHIDQIPSPNFVPSGHPLHTQPSQGRTTPNLTGIPSQPGASIGQQPTVPCHSQLPSGPQGAPNTQQPAGAPYSSHGSTGAPTNNYLPAGAPTNKYLPAAAPANSHLTAGTLVSSQLPGISTSYALPSDAPTSSHPSTGTPANNLPAGAPVHPPASTLVSSQLPTSGPTSSYSSILAPGNFHVPTNSSITSQAGPALNTSQLHQPTVVGAPTSFSAAHTPFQSGHPFTTSQSVTTTQPPQVCNHPQNIIPQNARPTLPTSEVDIGMVSQNHPLPPSTVGFSQISTTMPTGGHYVTQTSLPSSPQYTQHGVSTAQLPPSTINSVTRHSTTSIVSGSTGQVNAMSSSPIPSQVPQSSMQTVPTTTNIRQSHHPNVSIAGFAINASHTSQFNVPPNPQQQSPRVVNPGPMVPYNRPHLTQPQNRALRPAAPGPAPPKQAAPVDLLAGPVGDIGHSPLQPVMSTPQSSGRASPASSVISEYSSRNTQQPSSMQPPGHQSILQQSTPQHQQVIRPQSQQPPQHPGQYQYTPPNLQQPGQQQPRLQQSQLTPQQSHSTIQQQNLLSSQQQPHQLGQQLQQLPPHMRQQTQQFPPHLQQQAQALSPQVHQQQAQQLPSHLQQPQNIRNTAPQGSNHVTPQQHSLQPQPQPQQPQQSSQPQQQQQSSQPQQQQFPSCSMPQPLSQVQQQHTGQQPISNNPISNQNLPRQPPVAPQEQRAVPQPIQSGQGPVPLSHLQEPMSSTEGVQKWLSTQPGGFPTSQPASRPTPAKPIQSVSPQPKANSSHIDDMVGVTIMPSVPRLDANFESKIDWSLATIMPVKDKSPDKPDSTKSKNEHSSGRAPPSADRNVSRQVSRDSREPYSDESSLEEFVSAVERFVKLIDSITKPSLSGPTPLDKTWQDMLEEQEREGKRMSTAAGLNDKYRVLLRGAKNDYINASLIDNLPQGCPRIIATQGPLNQTEADFWNLVLQDKIEVIAMLSRWTENDQSETARYWPKDRNDKLSFGDLLMTLHLSNKHKYWIERRINITNLVTKDTHQVTQLQFTGWSTSGDLPEPMALLLYVSEVTSLYKKQRSLNTPIVVHCSNGISKTGVFCTLYHGITSINSGLGIINIRRTVDLLRQRRRGMVSTKDEYLYCHKALLYYAQDILVKRGILTSQASFATPLPQPGNKSHGRTPSSDFIMSDTSLALLGELSSFHIQPLSKSVDVSAHPAQQPTTSTSGHPPATAVTPPKVSAAPGGQSTTASLEVNKPMAVSNTNQSPLNQDVRTSVVVQESSQNIDQQSATKGASSNITQLQNPQTFELGQGRQRITKADFLDPKPAFKSDEASDDPFGMLDPLWSMSSKSYT